MLIKISMHERERSPTPTPPPPQEKIPDIQAHPQHERGELSTHNPPHNITLLNTCRNETKHEEEPQPHLT